MTDNLFTKRAEIIPLDGGELVFYGDFIPETECSQWFQTLSQQLQWRQDQLQFAGRTVNVPRLQAWYGDPDTHYTYSGLRMEPLPWSPALHSLRQRLETATGYRFNSALANFYRHQRDSVSWHADDEPELGHNPVIASISFGETRPFHLRHKRRKDLDTVKINLTSGSLLIMKGATQHNWKHQVPKSQRELGPRINLTFRWVWTESG